MSPESDNTEVKRIKVNASTTYDGENIPVEVNSSKPLKLSTENFDVYVIVRIRNYANDAVNADEHDKALQYFDSEHHKNDSFSVQFVVTFRTDVSGERLVWGNDWDTPIRDILPWGFSAAFASFKYAIDPGVDGDPYADKPWIYGAVLSSINYMEKLDSTTPPQSVLGPIEEAGNKARHKEYLDKTKLKQFQFKAGQSYAFDFSNPYLDMSSSPKLKLPGFTFDVGKYAGMTELRYVLKCDDELIFALTFAAEK